MTEEFETRRVGSKGELFPPKKIREELGLDPHRKVAYRIEGERLVVEPLPTVEEVLEMPSEVEIEAEEFYAFREELSKRAEE